MRVGLTALTGAGLLTSGAKGVFGARNESFAFGAIGALGACLKATFLKENEFFETLGTTGTDGTDLLANMLVMKN